MGKKIHVHTTINGEPSEFLCEARDTLLDVLRDVMGLTGTKEGCNNGNCGACSVLLDDVPVDACLVLGVESEGAEVTTVEGIARDGRLHPIQVSLLEGAGLQCAICTPGIVVTAFALLQQNPDPTEQEIRFELAGNICRCTGYDKIVRSVQAAARLLAEESGASAETETLLV